MEAKNLIDKAYSIAQKRGLNQSQWSNIAGYAVNGQTVSRMRKSGDCRVSTLMTLLDSIGYELTITEKN